MSDHTIVVIRSSSYNGAGAAERSYPPSKLRGGTQEEISHTQGKEQRLHFAGSAVKKYPVGPYMGNLKKKGV